MNITLTGRQGGSRGAEEQGRKNTPLPGLKPLSLTWKRKKKIVAETRSEI